MDSKDISYLALFESASKHPLNLETGLYTDRMKNFLNTEHLTYEHRRILIRNHIEQEHEQLQNALAENQGRHIKLYSACISLAHVSRWSESEERVGLFDESVQGTMSITNDLARLDALCAIAFYSRSDCDQIQISTGRSLQQEIEYKFNDIYPTLPLLLNTAIFI
jgi:hypothetical protein